MAKSRRRGGGARPIQVGEQVRQALSEMLRDGILKDPRLASASLVTITEVKMTEDLKLARAYVSIYGAEEPNDIVDALNDAHKVVQRELADRLELRYTPKIEFGRDDSIAYGSKTESLLSDIRREATEDE